MIPSRWRAGWTCIAILAAAGALFCGGRPEVIIPGALIVAALVFAWDREDTDLYILAAGQLMVYGAAYGSYFSALICEGALFAVVLGNTRQRLLLVTGVSLILLGIAAHMMYHTGWWIAGVAGICAVLVISGYTREEAISRRMKHEKTDR